MKQLRVIQIMVIGAGTLFAWYTIVSDFIRFYNIEGTVFRLDCPTVNPVKTACFTAALDFLLQLCGR